MHTPFWRALKVYSRQVARVIVTRKTASIPESSARVICAVMITKGAQRANYKSYDIHIPETHGCERHVIPNARVSDALEMDSGKMNCFNFFPIKCNNGVRFKPSFKHYRSQDINDRFTLARLLTTSRKVLETVIGRTLSDVTFKEVFGGGRSGATASMSSSSQRMISFCCSYITTMTMQFVSAPSYHATVKAKTTS